MLPASYRDLDQFRELVEPERFVFAKTMPQIPHWYTLRRSWADQEGFSEAVRLIRRIGYTAAYGRRKYTYLNLNGFKYWTMGEPVQVCPLINRAAVSYPSPFDSVAAVYDERFAAPEFRQEDFAIMAMLPYVDHERVLDIGSGTGLLLDYLSYDPARYVGVEPSLEMRVRFTMKHPNHRVIPAPLEDCAAGKFDLIVALYGTASYLAPEALATIRERLWPGGRLFLMFYELGYEPVSCIGGEPSNHYPGPTWEYVDGKAERFGHYWIVR